MPDDNSYDDEDWYDGEDDDLNDTEAVPCPECGTELYAAADHCHQCGYWLNGADRRALDRDYFPSRRVRFVALLVLIVFVIALLAGSGAFF